MPITKEQQEILANAANRTLDDARMLANGLQASALEKAKMARLVYETLLDAREHGWGFNAMSIFGKHLIDRENGSWENIKIVEEATGLSLRAPLIRSVEKIFYKGLASTFADLDEQESAQLVLGLSTPIEPDELIRLTRILYEALRRLPLDTEQMIAFGKLLYAKAPFSPAAPNDDALPTTLRIALASICVEHIFLRLKTVFTEKPEEPALEEPAASESLLTDLSDTSEAVEETEAAEEVAASEKSEESEESEESKEAEETEEPEETREPARRAAMSRSNGAAEKRRGKKQDTKKTPTPEIEQ